MVNFSREGILLEDSGNLLLSQSRSGDKKLEILEGNFDVWKERYVTDFDVAEMRSFSEDREMKLVFACVFLPERRKFQVVSIYFQLSKC